MSARDRLDRYEQDWAQHVRWRMPEAHDRCEPGTYIGEAIMGGTQVAFREIPTDLRDRVAKRLEDCVRGLVDEEHAKLVEELRVAAVAEAKATLEELGSHVAVLIRQPGISFTEITETLDLAERQRRRDIEQSAPAEADVAP